MTDIEFIHNLAIQYFDGTISLDDEKILFEYVNSDDNAKYNFRVWEKKWQSVILDSSDTDIVWKNIDAKIRVKRNYNNKFNFIFNRRTLLSSVAAFVVLIVGLTFTTSYFKRSSSASDTYFICSAPVGEMCEIVLSDSTVVWLNSGSKLLYTSQFNKSREVILEGEGYFEVTKKNGNNFTVHTNSYEVVVKGTKFNISSYEEDSVTTTTLLEGKVEIYKKGNEDKYVLVPGESIAYNLRENAFSKEKVDTSEYVSWHNKNFKYLDISLENLIVRLNRQYGVDIQLDESVQNLKKNEFYINLKNKETIDEILYALEKVLPITVKKDGKCILIRRK